MTYPEPPPVPEGLIVKPPDFVGVGANRSGTTWWTTVLCSHPQIDVGNQAPKERHFFDRFCVQSPSPRDIEDYARWFPRRPGCITGEFTPRYMCMRCTNRCGCEIRTRR